jgi:hypothetical protein
VLDVEPRRPTMARKKNKQAQKIKKAEKEKKAAAA